MNTVKRMRAWGAWEYGMEVREGFLEEVLVDSSQPLSNGMQTILQVSIFLGP